VARGGSNLQFPAEDTSDPKNQLCTASIVLADPLLGALAFNGGTQRTLALNAASPAMDAGVDPDCPATDQRGMPRPADGDGDADQHRNEHGHAPAPITDGHRDAPDSDRHQDADTNHHSDTHPNHRPR
jgi:hypothetical protein